MRNYVYLLLCIVIVASCKKENLDSNNVKPSPDLEDGFAVVINDSAVYNYTQIDFYDASAHLVYLKDGNTFSFSDNGSFKVFANTEEIYSGILLPGFSSLRPAGAFIEGYFGNYIIPISYNQSVATTDLREDPKIIEALQKHNQYLKGLSCKIDTIIFASNTSATFTLTLTNNDDVNYYYLDPQKMGTNLFHYFTNGLYTFDASITAYRYLFNRANVEQPKPNYNSWDKTWLSLLAGKASTKITISYANFDPIAKGTYTMSFFFPGLSHQVEKKDLQQTNGRIWLGHLNIEKQVTLK